MPTSDPVRRRQQNRENQKKFRKKQLQNLADLRAAYESQAVRLHEAEREIERLTKKVEAARRVISRCGPILSSIQDAVDDFTTAGSGVASTDDNDSKADTTKAFNHEMKNVFDTPLDLVPEPILEEDPAMENSNLFALHDGPNHIISSDETEDWLDFSGLDLQQIAESPTTDSGDAAQTPPLDLAGWAMGVTTHARDNISACLQADYSNSRLSKHIVTVNSLIQHEYNGLMPKRNFSSFKAVADAVAWIMQSWSTSIGALEMMSTLQELRNYEIWRNFPTEANLKRIHPMYRPTVAQILCPHAPALDWLPWPALRDKAIEMQDSLDIDMVNTKALYYTVLDCLQRGSSRATSDSVRVWDIYSLAQSSSVQADSTAISPNPIHAFLQKQGLPVDVISNLRLELAFFEAFPALWSPELLTSSRIAPISTVEPQPLLVPEDLQHASLLELKSLLGQAPPAMPETTAGTVFEIH